MFTTPDGHVDAMLNVHREDTAHERLASWSAMRRQRLDQARAEAQARQDQRHATLHLRAEVLR